MARSKKSNPESVGAILDKPDTRARKTKAEINSDNKAAIAQKFQAPTIEQQTTDISMVSKRGAPTTYSQAIATKLCAMIASGMSLRSVCREDGMPGLTTVFGWLGKHPEFSKQYTQACEERTDAMAEDILDIADNGTNDYMEILDANGEKTGGWRYNGEAVQRSKLRIDARQWHMSKMKPKKYGAQFSLDPNDNGQVVPALIYIPKELPYNAVNQNRKEVANGSTEQPATAPQAGETPS